MSEQPRATLHTDERRADNGATSSNDGAQMPRPRQRSRLALSLAFADLALVFLGVSLGLVIGWGASLPLLVLAAAIAVWTIPAFALTELYGGSFARSDRISESARIIAALSGTSLVGLLAVLLMEPGWADRKAAVFVLIMVPVLGVTMSLVRGSVRGRVMRSDPERVLIFGAGGTGQAIAHSIQNDPARDAVVVGFVDDDPLPLEGDLSALPIFPANDQLIDAVRESRAERILLAFSRTPATDVLATIRASSSGDIPISVVPRFYEITPLHASLSSLGGTTVVDLASASLSRGARISKRVLDLVIGGLALVMLSPVMLACAIAIKIDSRGPVFFRQERLGHRGEPFEIVKFRSMRTDAEAQRQAMAELNEMENSGPLFKMKRDPRVTRVGDFLRRTSLDELPQLFNVMAGTMSLVGPRPFVTHEAVQITGWHARRLDIVPGITGLWQMKGRNDVSFEDMVRMDYQYVANWSPWWDLRIILGTIPAVLKGSGAS